MKHQLLEYRPLIPSIDYTTITIRNAPEMVPTGDRGNEPTEASSPVAAGAVATATTTSPERPDLFTCCPGGVARTRWMTVHLRRTHRRKSCPDRSHSHVAYAAAALRGTSAMSVRRIPDAPVSLLVLATAGTAGDHAGAWSSLASWRRSAPSAPSAELPGRGFRRICRRPNRRWWRRCATRTHETGRGHRGEHISDRLGGTPNPSGKARVIQFRAGRLVESGWWLWCSR